MKFSEYIQQRHAEWVWHIDDMEQEFTSHSYSMILEEDSMSVLRNCLDTKLSLLLGSGKKSTQLRFCLIVQKGVELLMDELNELTEYFERQDNDSMEVTFGYAVNAVQEKKLCLALLIDVDDGKKWTEVLRLRMESLVDEVNESADGEREIARIGDKWGFVGDNPDSFVYDRLEYTQNAYEFLCLKDGKWGVTIHYPHNELPAEYDEIIYRDGWYLIRKGGKWGLQIWGTHIPPMYDEIYVPSIEGSVRVRLGEEWGYIDSNLQFTTRLADDVLSREEQ